MCNLAIAPQRAGARTLSTGRGLGETQSLFRFGRLREAAEADAWHVGWEGQSTWAENGEGEAKWSDGCGREQRGKERGTSQECCLLPFSYPWFTTTSKTLLSGGYQGMPKMQVPQKWEQNGTLCSVPWMAFTFGASIDLYCEFHRRNGSASFIKVIAHLHLNTVFGGYSRLEPS